MADITIVFMGFISPLTKLGGTILYEPDLIHSEPKHTWYLRLGMMSENGQHLYCLLVFIWTAHSLVQACAMYLVLPDSTLNGYFSSSTHTYWTLFCWLMHGKCLCLVLYKGKNHASSAHQAKSCYSMLFHAIPFVLVRVATCLTLQHTLTFPDLVSWGLSKSLAQNWCMASRVLGGPVIQGVWTPDLCLMGDVQIRHFTIAVGMMSHHFSSCLPFLMVSDNFSSLVGGFKHFLFSIYGMSSFPLTNSYFSRWLLHHQPDLVFTLSNLFSIPSDNLTACYWKWPIE